MSGYNYVTGLVSAAFIVVGFGMLGRAALQIYRTLTLGRPDPTRSGPVLPRAKTLVKEFLGHTRMLKWGIVGVAHWFVMVGFGALVLTLVEAVGETFHPQFEIPWLGHQAWYGLFVELIGLTTVLGIATLITIRQLAHPRRVNRRSRFQGSNFPQAYFVEAVILSIGICIFLIRGFKSATGNLPYPTWAAPISTGLGHILPSSLAAISVVALIKVIISMVWAIVISRNLTMGVAWHRFLAFFNIYFKRSDVGGTALGALRPMMSNGEVLDFEKADPEKDTFGAGKIEDFTWKGWLDFSTCTECGRCQSQCPAWNTAKPLSPKLVMLALRDHAFAKAPYLAAGGGTDMAGVEKLSDEALAAFAHENPLAMLEAGRPLIGGPEVGGIIDPEVLWDCTTCGACVEQCPVDIEHVDHIVDMRRYQVMIESEFPSELGGLFRNLENKGNPWGQNQRDRMDWAKGLDFEVPVVTDVIDDDHEYLFWVGCAGAFEDKAKKTTRAIAELLHIAAVGFAVLGTGETCTGDPARRAGNEFLFQMLAQQNVETINAAFGGRKRKKIVVSCAHCFNTLLNEYPQLGGEYEVVHHTQLLNKLVREKRLVRKVDVQPANVTYHDPCYLGRHNKVYSPPRELIAAAGLQLTEMPRNQARSMCCGAGGARMWMEEKIGKRINLERVDEALETGATQVATGCPFCRVMLTDGLTARQGQDEPVGADVEVIDVAQMLLAGVRGA
ncbi:Fe-S oxidoreductase [Nakamurella panacisegetis]|uniref:Fe-S oxidoreductase n=1 Tax=Nakamurella panacisegetis TaxID=1090615 RepID=A0A1H0MIF2_9ACTN|nr:(Fe-S)-binding protein [Nakamurella panacisegetis]SDO80219.1 Fe-S oxidoreductase [Nakamurella panacisegetis]